MLGSRFRRCTSLITNKYYTHQSKPIIVEEMSSKATQTKIASTLRPHFENQFPVLLKGVNTDSSATSKWKSLEYLETKVGGDTPCMVEIGGTYSNMGTQRQEISFGDYIQYMNMFQKQYGNLATSSGEQPNSKELVYLAQNDLFSPLLKDFQLPKLCRDQSLNVGFGSLYSTMLWFGPRTCISPLHFDPLDNLLMQFVGRKKVVLFPRSPSQNKDGAGWHYAGCDGQQYNTSPVDILNPDIKKYPKFVKAPTAIVCYLDPGDVCYIPKKWWHHVTSIDTSISVNAWWR